MTGHFVKSVEPVRKLLGTGSSCPILCLPSYGCLTWMHFSCGALPSVTIRQEVISIISYSVTYSVFYNKTRTTSCYNQASSSTSKNKTSTRVEIISWCIVAQRNATQEKRTRMGQALKSQKGRYIPERRLYVTRVTTKIPSSCNSDWTCNNWQLFDRVIGRPGSSTNKVYIFCCKNEKLPDVSYLLLINVWANFSEILSSKLKYKIIHGFRRASPERKYR